MPPTAPGEDPWGSRFPAPTKINDFPTVNNHKQICIHLQMPGVLQQLKSPSDQTYDNHNVTLEYPSDFCTGQTGKLNRRWDRNQHFCIFQGFGGSTNHQHSHHRMVLICLLFFFNTGQVHSLIEPHFMDQRADVRILPDDKPAYYKCHSKSGKLITRGFVGLLDLLRNDAAGAHKSPF